MSILDVKEVYIMKIVILGGAGFIGTNLVKLLSIDDVAEILVVDTNDIFFENIKKLGNNKVSYKVVEFIETTDFDNIFKGAEIVYHMYSTTIPSTANQQIAEELKVNVVLTSYILDACVRQNVGRIVFISSGGTVYGKELECPLKEDSITYPITSYGMQKVAVEKLLYLYNYIYGLDYRVIRLANPYGPYQRPNGLLGVVSTFTYKALKKEDLVIYGDGQVIRDFIYIDDAINAIINISLNTTNYKTYNVGSGHGISIQDVVKVIKNTLDNDVNVIYTGGRAVDVPVNFLDISRYEKEFGNIVTVGLQEGIELTAQFMRDMINNSEKNIEH